MAHMNVQLDLDVVGETPDLVSGVLEAFAERIRDTEHHSESLQPGEWGTLVDDDLIAGRWWVSDD